MTPDCTEYGVRRASGPNLLLDRLDQLGNSGASAAGVRGINPMLDYRDSITTLVETVPLGYLYAVADRREVLKASARAVNMTSSPNQHSLRNPAETDNTKLIFTDSIYRLIPEPLIYATSTTQPPPSPPDHTTTSTPSPLLPTRKPQHHHTLTTFPARELPQVIPPSHVAPSPPRTQ